MTEVQTKISPMMAQWHECKERAGSAFLLFRLGDFYEAFYDDALALSKILDLTLTKRQEIPMCGIPAHTSEGYIDRLLAKGHCVAVAEQIDDPKTTKGLVRRAITRILTPGTLIDSSLLRDKESSFLVSLVRVNACYGLAWADLSTGEFRVVELEDPQALADELTRLEPRELLTSNRLWREVEPLLGGPIRAQRTPVTLKEEWFFHHAQSYEELTRHFGVHTLDGFGLKGHIGAINAAGALLTYLRDDLAAPVQQLQVLRLESPSAFMAIDASTQRHLELLLPLQSEEGTSLLQVLDQTETAMGARLLRGWVTRPLLLVPEIESRHDAVAHLVARPALCRDLAHSLGPIRDLERLLVRIESSRAVPRDLYLLRTSLEQLPLLTGLLSSEALPSLLGTIARGIGDFSPLAGELAAALAESPPTQLGEGTTFRPGYDAELDLSLSLHRDSHHWMARYQEQLREETGIKGLKVGFTRVFGYYIEVTHAHAAKLPPSVIRRQTLAQSERFVTEELRTFEQKILHAEARIASREAELFHLLSGHVLQQAALLRQTTTALAQLDALLSLARIALDKQWVRPSVDESDELVIELGRHPIVEPMLSGESFVPNDTTLDSTARFLLITGPNMGGKSTYLRQVALIAILAQIGSFVPAKRAHVGLVDKVLSRIGASDNLARGQSTFMVEMAETAHILRSATSRSLVLLDEIGRGTSTYDGIAIAWAVAEALAHGPKTLFATHYWEMTALATQFPTVRNVQVALHESAEGITFLHRIVPGAADKSYGIHVARLAGLPPATLQRAWQILHQLEEGTSLGIAPSPSVPSPPQQMELFPIAAATATHEQQTIQALRKLDLCQITPMQALQLLAEWQAGLCSTRHS